MIHQPSILAVVQARLSSTRLPGKVLRQVNGEPLIGYLLLRLRKSIRVTRVMVATSIDSSDDPLVDYLETSGIEYRRGDLANVFDRFHQIAMDYNPDLMVRITADCPLLDYQLLDFCIDCHLHHQPELTATNNETGFPRGVDVEIFPPQTLDHIVSLHPTRSDLEHVTLKAYRQWQEFRLHFINPLPDYRAWHSFRLCVDQIEDFNLVERILKHFQPSLDFTLNELYQLMKLYPDWFSVNRSVQSKISLDVDQIANVQGYSLFDPQQPYWKMKTLSPNMSSQPVEKNEKTIETEIE